MAKTAFQENAFQNDVDFATAGFQVVFVAPITYAGAEFYNGLRRLPSNAPNRAPSHIIARESMFNRAPRIGGGRRSIIARPE